MTDMENVGNNDGSEVLYITFDSEDTIQRFVDTCNHYDDSVDVVWRKMKIDAKSLLGMLQLPLRETLPIEYGCFDDEDNYQAFREDVLAHYQVTVQKKSI